MRLLRFALVMLALAAAAAQAAAPPPLRTVCTVTVNSPDEKQALRRHLPPSHWRFVELVEPGRPDWLAAACRAGVRCDVLVVSGHYDGGNQFFSDRLDAQEHLPVAELERASCSPSCAGLFRALKEVHLFGCNTLNPQAQSSADAERVRSLVRERSSAGLPPSEAGRGESSRDRMRQIFPGVPVIYGFSSMAPLGPIAAESLERWLRGGGGAELARGRPSAALLAAFNGVGLTAVPGLRADEPLAAARTHMCSLSDGDRPLAERVAAVHRLLARDVAGAGVHLDRLQRTLAEVPAAQRVQGEVARAFERMAADGAARSRWLASTRETASPSLRLRLIDLAHEAGWFSDDERRDERVRLLVDLHDRREVGLREIDLACTLNDDRELEGLFRRRVAAGSAADDLAHAALNACLGSADAHRRVLAALTGGDEAEVALAQAYLRQRPIADADELRRVATAVLMMAPSAAQVRALETLGRHYLSDAAVIDALVRLYGQTPSPAVQEAVAGILMRADPRSLPVPRVLQTLRAHRLPAAGTAPMTEALLRRLTAS